MPSVYREHPFDCSSFRDLCNLFFVDRAGRKVIFKRATMPTKKKPTSYTITEAAKKLGITRAAVHEAIRTGRLKATWGEMVVRAKRISVDAIESYEVSKRHRSAGKKIIDA